MYNIPWPRRNNQINGESSMSKPGSSASSRGYNVTKKNVRRVDDTPFEAWNRKYEAGNRTNDRINELIKSINAKSNARKFYHNKNKIENKPYSINRKPMKVVYQRPCLSSSHSFAASVREKVQCQSADSNKLLALPFIANSTSKDLHCCFVNKNFNKPRDSSSKFGRVRKTVRFADDVKKQ